MDKEKIATIIIRSLSGQASPEEEQALQGWLQQGEANQQEYALARQLWVAAAEVDYSLDPQTPAEWGKLSRRLGSEGRGRVVGLPFWRYAAAAVLALGLIALAALYFNQGFERGPAIAQQYRTAPGELQQFTLPDGSTAHLNAGSTLSVLKGFGGKERRLILDGEAFFEVRPNAQQPFIVEAQGAETRVLGTAFNLRAHSGNEAVLLAVTEGSVSLGSTALPEGGAILKAGQAARLDRVSGQVSPMPFDERAMAWQHGLLVFDNILFSEALQALERHYAVEIENRAGLQGQRYTAVFDNRPLEEVLSVMAATLGFQLKMEEGKFIVYL
jgi:transmembrane sensor